jgi:monoamine oxidase
MSTIHKKIVIIGAGLSGLTLANELIKQGHPSEELLVVESKNRHGGLIKTTQEKGYITEWGPEGLRGGKPGTEKIFSYISSKPMELKFPRVLSAQFSPHLSHSSANLDCFSSFL